MVRTRERIEELEVKVAKLEAERDKLLKENAVLLKAVYDLECDTLNYAAGRPIDDHQNH